MWMPSGIPSEDRWYIQCAETHTTIKFNTCTFKIKTVIAIVVFIVRVIFLDFVILVINIIIVFKHQVNAIESCLIIITIRDYVFLVNDYRHIGFLHRT